MRKRDDIIQKQQNIQAEGVSSPFLLSTFGRVFMSGENGEKILSQFLTRWRMWRKVFATFAKMAKMAENG
jgi:hypothetical protein